MYALQREQSRATACSLGNRPPKSPRLSTNLPHSRGPGDVGATGLRQKLLPSSFLKTIARIHAGFEMSTGDEMQDFTVCRDDIEGTSGGDVSSSVFSGRVTRILRGSPRPGCVGTSAGLGWTGVSECQV